MMTRKHSPIRGDPAMRMINFLNLYSYCLMDTGKLELWRSECCSRLSRTHSIAFFFTHTPADAPTISPACDPAV